MSKKKQYCSNCNKYGHSNKECSEPITSAGIICLDIHDNLKNNMLKNDIDLISEDIGLYNYQRLSNINKIKKYKDKISFLLVQRKHSLNYINFIRGIYDENDYNQIEKIFSLMSNNEIKTIHKNDFDYLWNNLWEKTAKKEWIEKITTISGYSGKILNEHMLPKFDFAYIDGAHFFDAVKHDFYSFLNHANTEIGILFDDYIDRPNYGIKNLIDTDISKNFDVSLIKTDTNLHLERILSLDKHDYGMCWLDSKSLKKPLDDVYSKSTRDKYIKTYLKFENRLARRYDLNKKFPMLKNIRFKFWN